jgi:arsenate reductase (glutaredoxin)
MKATIWHNPNCSKSRQALETLQAEPGIDLTVIQYLKDPPTAQKLAQLYSDADMPAREGLRLSGTDAKERVAEEPKLIERPLVETEKGVRLCRPPEKIREIL